MSLFCKVVLIHAVSAEICNLIFLKTIYSVLHRKQFVMSQPTGYRQIKPTNPEAFERDVEILILDFPNVSHE